MNKPNYFLKHLCSLMIFTIFCLFLAGCNPNGAFSAPQGNNDKKLVSIQISPADITTQDPTYPLPKEIASHLLL